MTALPVPVQFFKTILFCIVITLFLVLPSVSFAQNYANGSTETPIDLNTLTPQNPNYGNMLIYNTTHTLLCFTKGQSPIAPCLDYKLTSELSGLTKSVPILSSNNTPGGLLGIEASLLANLYIYKPIETGEYLADLGSQIGLVKSANAQVGGSGNQVLAPIFNLWKASRNFAYLAMILIFIVIGIMVMFRQKLNPQTIVTVQLALPGLVIGLVMITFSYFLASLITDLTYIGTGVVGYYFDQATGSKGENLTKLLETENVISLGSSFVGKVDPSALQEASNTLIDNIDNEKSGLGWRNLWLSPQQTVAAAIAAITYAASSTLLNGVAAAVGGAALGTAGIFAGPGLLVAAPALAATAPAWVPIVAGAAFMVQNLGGPILGTTAAIAAYNNPGSALSLVLSLLLIFVVLYAVFRILIALLTAYLSLIVFTILAPFIFLFASLPGRTGSFTGWVRSMISNALAFPAIMAALYLAAVLMGPCTITPFKIGNTDASGARDICVPPTANNIQRDPFTVYAQDTGVASKFALPGLGILNNRIVNQGVAIIVLLSASSLPGLIKESLAKGDQLGKGLEGAFNQNIGGGRGWQNALYSGIGAYYGASSKKLEEWRGNPPGSSKAEQFAAITGSDPRRLWIKPHSVQFEDYKDLETRKKGKKTQEQSAADQEQKRVDEMETTGTVVPTGTIDEGSIDTHDS